MDNFTLSRIYTIDQLTEAEKEIANEAVNCTPRIRDFEDSLMMKLTEIYHEKYDPEIRWKMIFSVANDIMYKKTRRSIV